MISKRVISIHFPKAAGTSLKTQLERHVGSGLFLDYSHGPLGNNTSEQPAKFPDHIRAVHGHFRADRYDRETDAVRVTILRHPVDNLVSIYFFWLGLRPAGNPVHERFLIERPPVEEFARYPGICDLMSDRYFGGFDMNRMDFVGFHEDRESDIPRLGAFLGLPLVADVYENRTASPEDADRTELMQDRVRLGRIADGVAKDIAFYEAQYRRWGGGKTTQKTPPTEASGANCRS